MPTKRFLPLLLAPGFVSALVLAGCVSMSTAPAAGGSGVMGSSVFDWNTIASRATTNEHGLFARVFTSRTATFNNIECHVTTLNPGIASHPPHHHPEEEIVIIREGTVEALVNGEWKRVGPGSIIFNACNITHDLRNVGDQPAVYHVFSWKTSMTPAATSHTDTLEDSKFEPKTGIMGPTVIDWNSVPVKTNANGLARQFFSSPIVTATLFECHATTVNPGQSTHAPSVHPDDREEAIVIREGTVEAYVKGEWKRLGPGSVVFNASHEMQAIRNVGDTPATYFVLMWQIHPAGA